MGFGRRVVRKSVRRVTPRPVRRAMHPARTVKYAVTPNWAAKGANAMIGLKGLQPPGFSGNLPWSAGVLHTANQGRRITGSG